MAPKIGDPMPIIRNCIAMAKPNTSLPVCTNYKVYNICGMGPPSSGGVAVAQILKILEPYDLQSLGYSNPITWQITACFNLYTSNVELIL